MKAGCYCNIDDDHETTETCYHCFYKIWGPYYRWFFKNHGDKYFEALEMIGSY
jgi:hypothetical protein